MTRALLRIALAVPLLAIGLGAASAAAQTGPARPLCAQAADANRVGIVVELGNAQVIRQCVGFSTTTITALTVLQDSDIEYATASYGGSLGEAVCQIDNEPAQYTSCLPASGSYWVVFIAPSGGAWTSALHGVSSETLSNGDDLGFRYDPLAGADPPPVSPAGTCPTPSPTPVPTAPATPTPVVTLPPAATSHPGAPTPSAAGVAPASTQGSALSGAGGATPTASVLGLSSPDASPVAALGVATKDVTDGPFNAALVIAVCAIAALIGLLGIQGLRRRRQ